MRIITCSIRNEGHGDITWVDDKLDHGEWSEGKGPSEDTRLIKPGETRTFEAASGGDIPILGSIGTGTQGWAVFRTLFTEFVGMPGTAFIKVSWNIPFITFHPQDGVKVETTRFDPRQVVGPGQFDDRDKTPPTPGLQISGFVAGQGGGDHLIDGLPWVFICPPMVVAGAKIGVNLILSVKGTAAPADTKMPSFSDKKNVVPIPEPMTNSNASAWVGFWSGQRASARITRVEGNHLSVTITERSEGQADLTLPPQTVSISRLLISHFDNLLARNPTEKLTNDEPGLGSKIHLYVQEGLGTSRAISKPIDQRSKLYQEVAARHGSVFAGLTNLKHQIGGDYLSLQPDATLEIFKLVARGQFAGFALRYRRPANIPTLYGAAHFDEMLYFYPDIH